MLTGRKGPVLFSLPEDTLDEEVPPAAFAWDLVAPLSPTSEAVRPIADMLQRAERPAILAGYGLAAAGARDLLVQFSERFGIPVFAAWRRPTVFPNDHPNFLGTTGYGSASTVRNRLLAADALLVIGCRLNEIASFDYAIPAADTRWAHVDLDPRSAHAGLVAPDFALTADAAAFLEVALALEPGPAVEQRREAIRTDRSAYLAATELPVSTWEGPGVDPAHVVATMQAVLAKDAIVTTDAGNFGLWPARYFKFGRDQVFLGPTSGAMGYGLPAAIAASLVEQDRQILALCGDGGLAMTMNELETAVRAGAKPVIVVFDNEKYGTIAMHQANEQRDSVATGLGPIDFAAVAHACGADGVRVSDDAAFEPCLRTALASGRTTVLHLQLDPRWISPDNPAPV
jgi:acetolactate synthase-1/2/3 large subunit